MIGRTLGAYRITEEIGKGGMATVYRAQQETVNRVVAIKVVSASLLSDTSAFSRFQREVEIIAALEHPHILPIYDYGKVEEIPYIAMRYLNGGNLGKFVGTASFEALEKPLTQIADALDFAHERKVIHRDLKPANILFDDKDNAYLGDFGIAHLRGSRLTTEGALLGTPAYMSPEQITNEELEPSSDVYSLGIVLFELITGQLPFDKGGALNMMYMHIHQPLPATADYRLDVPPAIEKVLQTATAKNAYDRYSSAGAMARAYSEALHSTTSTLNVSSVAALDEMAIMPTERLAARTPTPPPTQSQSAQQNLPTTTATDETPTTQQRRQTERNRARLLEKVEQFWIKDVYENSLYGTALLELGMERLPDAVEHAWDMVLQQPDMPNRTLTRGTRIVHVFDDMGGELLILGDPGSGKTTTLLELTRDLLQRARVETSLPIPVVFNLSSWAEKRPPLSEWLAHELHSKYQVPSKTAESWIQNDMISPLLDGLDEVNKEWRETCVEEINNFRVHHGLLPLAVCSRIADYKALTTKLKLSGAVLLQPLTIEQVNQYLIEAGDEVQALRMVLESDENLQQLTTSPLMLSIVALAYRDMSVAEVSAIKSVEQRRKHVFTTYVKRMLVRRGVRQRYSPEQTQRYLTWLASEMSSHSNTVFEIEELQGDWLTNPIFRKLFRLGGVPVAVLCALPIGLATGASVAYLVGLAAGVAPIALPTGIAIGGVLGLVVGIALGVFHWRDPRIHSVDALNLSFNLVVTLVGGIMGLLVGGMMGWVFAQAAGAVALGISAALICILALSLQQKQSVETRVSPNQGMWRIVSNIAQFMIVAGTPVGILGGLLLWAMDGMRIPFLLGLLCTLVAGWSISLALGFAAGGLNQLVKHLVLRIMLWLEGSAPLNLAAFLDEAASRVLLRKVGGGYLFIHRLLLVHFADYNKNNELKVKP